MIVFFLKKDLKNDKTAKNYINANTFRGYFALFFQQFSTDKRKMILFDDFFDVI
jgi:hypothetical protein